MAESERTVTVHFSPGAIRGLEAFAARNRLSLPGAVEKIVVQTVKKELSKEDAKQMEAESKVIAFVEQVVEEYRVAGWQKDVIERVFDEIEKRNLSDYSEAIGGDPFKFGNHEKARINRRIGKRVRQLLNADVLFRGGQRQKGQPPLAKNSLIKSFTLLEPRAFKRQGR